MPLYDLMYVIKPVVPRQQVVEILKRTGEYVIKSGGVVTEVTSYGTRELAYDFKLQGEKYSEVREGRCEWWDEACVHTKPSFEALKEILRLLTTNSFIHSYVVIKVFSMCAIIF